MDTSRVIETLDWAIERGVQPFTPAYPVDPISFQAAMITNNLVRGEEPILEAVSNVLRREPELRVFDGGVIGMKSGPAARLELRELSNWLLAQTLLHGSPAAVERLQEFVQGQHRGVLEVLALAGVTVEEEIEVSHEVSLIPFSSLPSSQMTELLLPAHIGYIGDPMRRMFVPSPTAALISDDKDSVELLEDFPEPTDDAAFASTQMLFHRISECLTLIGPSSPVPIAQWPQLRSPERVPILGMQSGWGHSLQESYPRIASPLPSSEDVSRLVEQYLTLGEVRDKLAIPLQRLNLALRRQNMVDKAIELGVALEALLVGDRDKDTPISYLLRVRGTWLGGGTLEERRGTRNLLNDVYDLRSEAVHSGKLKTRKKDRKTKQDPDEILRKGSMLCADLIRSVIERGSIPDWDTLILTPDPDLLSRE